MSPPDLGLRRPLSYLLLLAFCMEGLCVTVGCSKGVFERGAESASTWTCDKEADQAMRLHDYEAGIFLHQRLLDREPENALALYHLGYAYGQTGDHLKEAFYYEKAIALGFEADGIFFNLGMAYGELNKLKESIDALKRALNMNPNHSASHFGLGLAYHRSGYDKLAEEEFLEAIEIDPEHLEARLYLSMLYADRGDLQKAAEQLQEILAIDPTDRRAREALERIEAE